MNATGCQVCFGPLSSKDVSCPACGTSVPRPAPAAAGRRVVTGPLPSNSAPPSPATVSAGRRSAPAPASAAKQAATGRSVSGNRKPTVSGVITGMVQLDQVSRSTLPGFLLTKLLATVGSICLLLALLYLLLRMTLVALGAAVALLPGVFVILVLLYILRGAFVGFKVRRRPATDHSRSGAVVGRAFGALLRGSLQFVGRGASLGRSPDKAVAEVRRFRLVGADGSPVDCELLGEVRGPALRQGDDVQVSGRVQRNGAVRARKVSLARTGGCVTARLPLAFVATRVISVVVLGIAAMIAITAATYYA